jgi:endoribonuclease Dicer
MISDGPRELVVLFERPSKSSFTPLYKQLRLVDQEELILHLQFTAARHALVDLGSCASDLVWRRAIHDLDAALYHDADDDDDKIDASHGIAKLQMRDVIRNWEYTMPNLDPSSRGFNVTPKFMRLVHILKSCQEYGDAFRCIVFGSSIFVLCCFAGI